MTVFEQLLICAGGLGLASLAGSLAGMIVRRIPHKWNDIFLGFCAGMMLTAALVCLIVPSVDMAGKNGWWQPVTGVVLGVALIAVLDRITPHLHHIAGLEGNETEEVHTASTKSINRVLLFVIAIAIHKFPEGLAAGVVFDGEDMTNAYTVAITIAIQNIPEGMVVVTPLIMIGVSMWRVIGVSMSVALLEVAGVVAGYFLGDVSASLLPALTALAGGAMLYFVGYFYSLTHSISVILHIYISHPQQTCTKIAIKKSNEGGARAYWQVGIENIDVSFSIALSSFSCLELLSL